MIIHDISLRIHNDIPVWPGDPKVRLEWLLRIDQGDSVNLTALNMSAHTGTHIDMPKHFIDSGKTLDELDLDVLIGKARVIGVPYDVKVISEEYLRTVPLEGVERILFKTANSRLVVEQPLSFHPDYVALDISGGQYLARSGCKLVGIDYMSIGYYADPQGAHYPLLGADVIVLEGINLDGVEPGDYQLIALPLKLSGREGAPARAILIEN